MNTLTQYKQEIAQ